MGAGSSQDKASKQNEEESSKDAPQSSDIETQENKTREISLPHNCEEILKHADSPVDRSSPKKLVEQLNSGVYLNQKRKASTCLSLK